MDGDKRRLAAYAALFALILFLLFRSLKAGGTTIYQEGDNGDIIIEGLNPDTYELPPLTVPTLPGYTGNSTWDWMNTTGLFCDCEAPTPPIFVELAAPPPQRPVKSFVF